MKKLSFVILIIIALLAAAWFLLPWKLWLQDEIENQLAAFGAPKGVVVESVTPHAMVLHYTPGDPAFPVKELTLNIAYSPIELLQEKRLSDISVDEVTLSLKDMTVHLRDIKLQFAPPQEDVSVGGKWSIGDIQVEKSPLPLPPLAGAGTMEVRQGKFAADGTLISADETHRVAFNVTPEQLTVGSAKLPWSGGVISTKNAVFPLSGKAASTITLDVARVPLDVLLDAATGGRATATGVVSGQLPLTIHPDGAVTFKTGSLKGEQDGTIVLAPDAIPGDNEQIGLVREVMKNFHYRNLSLGVDSGKDDKLSILLSLSGNNPDVYNGREVKLNVHLTGDVLSLLQQSILPMSDPKQLLRQE